MQEVEDGGHGGHGEPWTWWRSAASTSSGKLSLTLARAQGERVRARDPGHGQQEATEELGHDEEEEEEEEEDDDDDDDELFWF